MVIHFFNDKKMGFKRSVSGNTVSMQRGVF